MMLMQTRDFALAKLKEPGYLVTVRKKILNVLKTKSIEHFAQTLGLSQGEDWELYIQIKDMIVDSEIIGCLQKYRTKSSASRQHLLARYKASE
jgi:hypothetical protein